jgi:hypothetical protein
MSRVLTKHHSDKLLFYFTILYLIEIINTYIFNGLLMALAEDFCKRLSVCYSIGAHGLASI